MTFSDTEKLRAGLFPARARILCWFIGQVDRFKEAYLKRVRIQSNIASPHNFEIYPVPSALLSIRTDCFDYL